MQSIVKSASRIPRWFLVLTVVIVVSGLEALAEIPWWRHGAWLATANLLGEGVFVTTGLLLRGEPGQRGTAWALFLAGVFHPLGWLYKWNAVPLPLYSQVFGYLDDTCGTWALLRYPGPRLGGPQRAYLLLMFGWLTGGSAVVAVLSRPQWNGYGYSQSAWWPVLYARPGIFQLASHIFFAGAVIIAVFLPVMVWQRVSSASAMARAELKPIAWIGTVAALVGAGVTVAEFISAAGDNLFAAEGFAALVLPVAFLLVVLRYKIQHGAVADLVIQLPASGAIGEVRQAVQDVLRQVLLDPELRVLYRDPGGTPYVDAGGRPAATPGRDTAQRALPVYTTGGKVPLALILADPGIAGHRHRALLDAAVKACVLALENTRLRGENELRLKDNRDLLERIAIAEQSVRAELEHDLHDRAQAMLQAVRLRLANAITVSADQVSNGHMQEAITEILDVIGALREIARDIHPHVLERYGLVAAVRDFTERHSTLRISVDIPDCRFRRAVELNAYLISCEALTNAARHAEASRAAVRVYTEDPPANRRGAVRKILCIEVRDNGRGGAHQRPGGGLAGLSDRVRALDGDLAIISPPGRGTQLIVRIPCE
jgi:signal transduction histidine kinase